MSNPRNQHTHNWQMKIKKGHVRKIDDNPYTNIGFDATQYWVCIRGGKIKHTLTAHKLGFDIGKKPDKTITKSFVIQASGFYNWDQKVDEQNFTGNFRRE